MLDGASLANEWSLPVLPEGVDYTTAVSVATHTHTHIMHCKLTCLLVQFFLLTLLLLTVCVFVTCVFDCLYVCMSNELSMCMCEETKN